MSKSWNEKYASGGNLSAEPHKLLAALADKSKPGKALDLACGVGRNANFLAEKGWHVTAVDNSSVGIEIARRRAVEKGLSVDFHLADLEKGEFHIEENSYDLICDFYYLQRDLFPKMKAGVKPNGIIISVIHIYGENEEKGKFSLKEGELKKYFSDFEIRHYRETAQNEAEAQRRRTAELIARRKA